MGERKMKIVDVARATELHRNTITLLYKEEASRVDLDAMNRLCRLFGCAVGELFEYVPDETT
jgi:putative transcriptional regulator